MKYDLKESAEVCEGENWSSPHPTERDPLGHTVTESAFNLTSPRQVIIDITVPPTGLSCPLIGWIVALVIL